MKSRSFTCSLEVTYGHDGTLGEGARPCLARAEKMGGPARLGRAGSGGCRRSPLQVALFVQCALSSIPVHTTTIPLCMSMRLACHLRSPMNKIAALFVQCPSPFTAVHTPTKSRGVSRICDRCQGACHLVHGMPRTFHTRQVSSTVEAGQQVHLSLCISCHLIALQVHDIHWSTSVKLNVRRPHCH